MKENTFKGINESFEGRMEWIASFLVPGAISSLSVFAYF